MPIILIMFLAVVLVIKLLVPDRKQKQKGYHRNDMMFSDAWKRIGNDKAKIDEREDYMEDMLLRTFKSRRDYYRDVYLKSDAWQRKRFVVMRRDSWRCVHCGEAATQVHHKKYARKIGKEPIEWLESVCKTCHDRLHS